MKPLIRFGAGFIMIVSGFGLLFLLYLLTMFVVEFNMGALIFVLLSGMVIGFMFYVSGYIAVKNRVPKIMKWAE